MCVGLLHYFEKGVTSLMMFISTHFVTGQHVNDTLFLKAAGLLKSTIYGVLFLIKGSCCRQFLYYLYRSVRTEIDAFWRMKLSLGFIYELDFAFQSVSNCIWDGLRIYVNLFSWNTWTWKMKDVYPKRSNALHTMNQESDMCYIFRIVPVTISCATKSVTKILRTTSFP